MGVVQVSTGVDGEAQGSSFQNSTQQSVGSVALSIATHVRVPEQISAHGGRAIAMLLVTELGAVVKKESALSFDVQIELRGAADEDQSAETKPQQVAAPKGVSLLLGVSADDQRGSFQNATMQGGAAAFSIATHIDVPVDVAAGREAAIAEYVQGTLDAAVKASPALSFDVQVGPLDETDPDEPVAGELSSLPSAFGM
jgi:hypothetical protein